MALSRLLILFFLHLQLSNNAWCQKKQVSIRIGQDETVLLDSYESEITLERKSFKIQVMLQHVTGVYVFAAFSDSICCRLNELDTIADFGNLPDRVMKEVEYNKDKELLINDNNSCAYWYYDKGKTWSGFNKKIVLLDTTQIVAVKSVKQIFYVPTQKEIKLKDIKQPIYIFFVAVDEFDANGHPLKELMRKKVKINWIDEN